MSNTATRIQDVKKALPAHVQLVAVSKTHSEAAIREAYEVGQRIFGENKVQELTEKYEHLPKDIEWHYIGHLQSNKVKYIAPFVSLIHGVDSIKLLKVINEQARLKDRIIDCLIQVHIAQEETKFGFDKEEVLAFFESTSMNEYPYVRICGLMGMATYTSDKDQVHAEFKCLKRTFDQIKEAHYSHDAYFSILSMGMSGDYEAAIEEGSTLVRIGSSIFGNR